jgi:murein L,D-transpeptidase YafK
MQEIRIFKSAGTLEHHVDGRLETRVDAQLGRNSRDKEKEGDEATPVGDFFVCAKNPKSRFHRSLCLSYPNAEHADRGLAHGLIDAAEHASILEALAAGRMPPQHTRLGGEIYIHGRAPNGTLGTRGCISVDDATIEKLFDRVPLGTRVIVLP